MQYLSPVPRGSILAIAKVLSYLPLTMGTALANPMTHIDNANTPETPQDAPVSLSAVDLSLHEPIETRLTSLEPTAEHAHGSELVADTPIAQGTDERAERPWKVTFWGGPLTDSDVGQALLFDVEFVDSYIVGVSGSRAIANLNDRVQLEAELQALKHFGDQDHLEFTAGLGVRWQVADAVSLAFIDGLSLATETPEIEAERADKANPLLNYFALEAEVDIADDWALAARIHHRSGVFGLFNGVKRGSNAYLVGLRHTL